MFDNCIFSYRKCKLSLHFTLIMVCAWTFSLLCRKYWETYCLSSVTLKILTYVFWSILPIPNMYMFFCFVFFFTYRSRKWFKPLLESSVHQHIKKYYVSQETLPKIWTECSFESHDMKRTFKIFLLVCNWLEALHEHVV